MKKPKKLSKGSLETCLNVPIQTNQQISSQALISDVEDLNGGSSGPLAYRDPHALTFIRKDTPDDSLEDFADLHFGLFRG